MDKEFSRQQRLALLYPEENWLFSLQKSRIDPYYFSNAWICYCPSISYAVGDLNFKPCSYMHVTPWEIRTMSCGGTVGSGVMAALEVISYSKNYFSSISLNYNICSENGHG